LAALAAVASHDALVAGLTSIALHAFAGVNIRLCHFRP
jgi:hypothetical protein